MIKPTSRRMPLIFLMMLGLLVISMTYAQSQDDNNSRLWAAVSINEPLHQEGWTRNLLIHFTLVNDGNATLDPEIDSSKIIVNGVEIENSAFILGNGPRSPEWNALPPGRSIQFAKAMGDYFERPGIYRVSWKGENFETRAIEFRVMPRN